MVVCDFRPFSRPTSALSSFSPSKQLCGIAEALYSHESLGDIFGNASWFDRAELIAYSAYPAALSKDMWAHNYLSEANEANAIKVSARL
jgi:uncharacterized protein